jgi:hypothetical protein
MGVSNVVYQTLSGHCFENGLSPPSPIFKLPISGGTYTLVCGVQGVNQQRDLPPGTVEVPLFTTTALHQPWY